MSVEQAADTDPGSRRVPPAGSVDEIVELYERWAGDPYDEEISQLDHALQTAALAVAAGATDALVAAALLHDVGHLLELAARDGSGDLPTDDLGHEAVGAGYLGSLFGPEVTAPIALHVAAKRYRCAVDPDYLSKLSAGSLRSLELQGGPADAAEVERFERHPRHAAALTLRGWDDAGKVDGLEVGTFADHVLLVRRVARRR